jgi:methyltransferase
VSEPFLGYAIVALVALQRAAELAWAASNASRLLARGGHRVPKEGSAGLILVHVLWLLAMAAERAGLGARIPAGWGWALGVAVALVEVLRAWTLGTLGRRWTIRVVVVPGEEPVARGPYRFLRHPNYVVVTLELLLIPLLVGAWRTALAVVIPHAITLAYRIRREEDAWRALARRPLGAPGRE